MSERHLGSESSVCILLVTHSTLKWLGRFLYKLHGVRGRWWWCSKGVPDQILGTIDLRVCLCMCVSCIGLLCQTALFQELERSVNYSIVSKYQFMALVIVVVTRSLIIVVMVVTLRAGCRL